MDEDERANYPDVERALSAAVDAVDQLLGEDAQESAPTVDDSATDDGHADCGW